MKIDFFLSKLLWNEIRKKLSFVSDLSGFSLSPSLDVHFDISNSKRMNKVELVE